MKCDELKYEKLGDMMPLYPRSTLVIRKQFVDAAIDELKEELYNQKWRGDEWARNANDKDKQIAELKTKLEDVQATAYAEIVDAGMRERKLKRALWLARAYRGYDNSILLPSKFMRKVWDYVERKCRVKAEEYK